MSYARGTQNYNLPQTQGTDKRDWSDTNAAFLAIDTAIKTANTTASSASSAASTAQSRADSAYTLASTANTAAGNASTAAATAGELAQTAKNRADSAYTLAQTADNNRGTIKVIKTATGSASKTWAALISEIASDVATQYAAGKHTGVIVKYGDSTFVMPLTVHETNGNWAFVIPRIFTGALLVYNISKASTSYRFGVWNSTSTYTDMSNEYTAGSSIELVVFG